MRAGTPAYGRLANPTRGRALSSSIKLSFDYQFIVNPGYNTDRGPVSAFAARFHATF